MEPQKPFLEQHLWFGGRFMQVVDFVEPHVPSLESVIVVKPLLLCES